MSRLSTLFSIWAVWVPSLGVAPAANAFPLFDVGPSGVDTLQMSHLPAWVQVATPTARLYVDDATEVPLAQRLSQTTFLRVLGGGSARLQVSAYEENGLPGVGGWVDPESVVPSAPGTDWRVASTAAPLWRSTQPGDDAVRYLDPFTPMQQIDGPVQNRIEVQIYATDFSRALDRGWIEAAATGPALSPRTAVPPPAAPTPARHSLSSTTGQQTFLTTAATVARASAAHTGVPASVTVAQAILESDWGRSSLAQDAQNYFGMKAIGSIGTDGVVWLPTSEFDDSGEAYATLSGFRAYKSLSDSVADHDHLLRTSSRYAAAMQSSSDPRQFAEQLFEAGYSTDPDYADKLVTLMDRYDLYRFDA